MTDMSIKLGIHEAVIEAAKEKFAKFREVKERVEKFKVYCVRVFYSPTKSCHEYDSKVSYDTVRSRDGLTNTSKPMLLRKEDDVVYDLGGKRVREWSLEDIKEWINNVATKDHNSKNLGCQTVKGNR